MEKFCLSLHPLSLLNGVRVAEVLRKIFLKKVTKKFGSFENMIYLCTRFSLLTKKGVEARLNWFFDLLVLYIERKV